MFGINGMEQNDVGALTPEQQQKLNEFKVTFRLRWEENKRRWSGVTTILKSYHNFFVHDQIKTRFENERYLREHPEVSCLLTGFLGWVSIKLIGDIHKKEASSFHLEELLLDTYAYTTWAYVFTKIFSVFGFKSFKLLKIINFVFPVAWNVDCLIFFPNIQLSCFKWTFIEMQLCITCYMTKTEFLLTISIPYVFNRIKKTIN